MCTTSLMLDDELLKRLLKLSVLRTESQAILIETYYILASLFHFFVFETASPLRMKFDINISTYHVGFILYNTPPPQLFSKIVSEYDQEIPQSQTADNPMAPQGRATQPPRDTRETN